MSAPQLALADELAAIRAEIARLRSRETALASIEHSFPKIPVFRRSQVQRAPQSGAGRLVTPSHA